MKFLRKERGRRQDVGSKVSGWTGSCSRFLHLQMQSKTRFQDKCLQVMLSEKPDWRPLPGLYSRESPPADLAPRRMYSHAFWCLAKKGKKKILKVLWSFWQLFIATVCTLEGLALANDLRNQPEAASVRLAEFRNTVNTFHLLGVRSSHAKPSKLQIIYCWSVLERVVGSTTLVHIGVYTIICLLSPDWDVRP